MASWRPRDPLHPPGQHFRGWERCVQVLVVGAVSCGGHGEDEEEGEEEEEQEEEEERMQTVVLTGCCRLCSRCRSLLAMWQLPKHLSEAGSSSLPAFPLTTERGPAAPRRAENGVISAESSALLNRKKKKKAGKIVLLIATFLSYPISSCSGLHPSSKVNQWPPK